MKKKFTILITAAFMLLTMMASTGTMWGQTRTEQTASYGFESGDAGWTATTFVTNNTAITAHGGSKYGATNGTTADVKYNSIVATPLSLTCYYSKTTTNTNASSKFTIQVSSNGTTWTTVATSLGMDQVTKGTWYELSADLSSYSNVYVRVRYDGTTGVRALDDITLTYDDGQSPSTDPVISFTPASVTLDDVLVNNETSTTFTVSQSNLDAGITLSVNNGELSQYSIDKDADPTSIIWTYTPTAAGSISATVTATSGETTQTLVISGTAIAPVEGYDVDFEYATNMYPNWTFNNMTTQQNSDITAHGGTYYGTTGGKATASLTTSDKVENPGTLTCYVSKASNNTTSSTWYIQVSTDGSSWTNVNSQDATSMSKGNWVVFTADLSNYSNVYVRIYYNGSTAVRTIDDLTLTTTAPSNIFTVTYNANGATSGTVPVDETQYDSDNNTVTVLGNTGNLEKAGHIWSGWCMNAGGTGDVYGPDYITTFTITENTTLYAKWNAKEITGLSYTGTPTKTEYYSGENFDPTGLTVTATFNDSSSEDVTTSVVWTPSPLTTGTTAVTGTYMGQIINVGGLTVTDAPGSQNNPYTVAQAIEATPASGTSANVYIHGIVSAFYSTSIVGDGSNYRYYISDDGTTTSQLLVYKGKGLNNVAFSSADELHIGDIVTIYGGLTMYQSAPEIASGNYLTSWERPAVDVEAPTFSVAAGGYAEAQTVEIACATEGATIKYSYDNETWNDYSEALTINETKTVYAKAIKDAGESTVSSAAYYILSNDNNYTVTHALAFDSYPQNNVFVHGIVSTAPTDLLDGGLLTYYISVDGTETNRLQVYKGKNLGNIEFTAADNIQVGDVVTIFGNVKVYNNQKEFDQGNYLVEFERLDKVATPTFDPAGGEYTEVQTVTINCTTEEATKYYKFAENAEWTIYSDPINVAETTTIWAYAAKGGMNNSAVATATYTINIPVFTPSITVDPALVEATAEGENGTLTVTYENITISGATDFGIQFYDGEENELNDEPDWLGVEVENGQTSGYVVSYIIVENESAARTAYFKVFAMGSEDFVYSNLVTINQAAPVIPSQEVTDVLNSDFTGVTGTTYTEWTNVGTSGAVYVGFSAGQNSTIQLRTKNSNEGIITTTSGGKVTKVEVTWNSSTSSGRKLDVYGKSTAYSVVSDLYDNENQGTKLGTIEYDDNEPLNISGDYEFIGIRSNDGALYLDEIQITWATGPAVPSIAVAPTEININADENIEELGVTVANISSIDIASFNVDYCNSDGSEIEGDKPDIIEDYEFTANTPEEGYTLTITFKANDGDARTAYFKVIYELGENDYVYSNVVTVNQEAYVAPVATITVNPAEINIDANENIEELGVTVANISSIDLASFNIDYCNSDGSEIEGDKPDIIDDYEFTANTPEEGYTLTITFKANEGDARTAYFKVKYELGENDYVYSNVVAVNQESTEVAGVTYELVTSTEDIVPDSYYLITSGINGDVKAMAGQGTNNRNAVGVTASDGVISEIGEAVEFVISGNGTDLNPYTIYDENVPGYLYAAGTGSSNHLKTQDEIDDRARWTITINNEHQATITALTTETDRKNIRYNSSSTIFSCYGTGQQPIYLFKRADNSPSISADNVNLEYNKTSGSIYYTINNYVEGTMAATTEADWISGFTYEQVEEIGTVGFTTTANEAYESRSATVTLTYTYEDTKATVTKDVTVTQAGAPIPTYTVSFDVDGGEFVPNDDFSDEIVEVEAGTYTLPSATKVGYSFSGWSDGEHTYAAGESYTVSDDVEFTATYTELLHFTIQFFVNNNHEEEDDMDVIQDTPILLPLTLTNTSTPDGFEIIGWSAVPSSTVAVPNPYTPEDDVVLYAILNYLYSEDSYELVTDASDLHEGDIVVIAALNSDYAISTTQNTNNRSQAAIAKSGNKIALSDGVCEFVLGNGSVENSWSFYDTVNNGDNKGYIYAASSEKNWLKTQQELTANSSWTININENTATITAQGSNTHNVLQYNLSNRIFSCYTSTTQQPVCLYKKNAAPSFNYVNTITDQEAQMDDDISETTCVVVADNVVLTFNGENNGTAANLIIEDGAQLIHNNEGVQATVRKNIKGFGDNTAGNYYFLVSPLVDDINPAIVTNMTPNGEGEDFDLYEWNSGEDEEWRNYKVTPFSLVNTTGYLYANKNNVTLNFEGTLLRSDAEVVINMNYEEGDDFGNWNLVGNPFACNANVSLNETAMAYYRMNTHGTEFEPSLDPITPMEGIFVKTTGTGQKCTFSRIDPEQSAGKGNLNLQIAQVVNNRDAQPDTDNAIVRFDGGNALEKFSFRDDNAKLYIPQNGKDYAVVSAEAQGEMPVYFKAAENGTYSISFSMDNVEFGYLHLIDNKTGNDVDLLQTQSYTFVASTIDYASRFRLVFKAIGNENDSENNDFGFFDANGNLLILGIEGTATLQVMDVTGRTISSETFSGDYSKAINASAGVYMLRLIQGNDVRTQKIVVK